MAFVERLDEVQDSLDLSVDASRAAVAVDRFLEHRDVAPTDINAVRSIIVRLVDELHAHPDADRPPNFVTLLTKQGGVDAFLGVRRQMPSAKQRSQMEQIKALLQEVVENKRARRERARREAELVAVRDALAALADHARTYVHDFAEQADAPEAEWNSPTSSLF